MRTRSVLPLLCLTFAFGPGFAVDEDLVSGPRAGSKLTPVRAYAATGPLAGKEFDAAKLIGEGPGALLFVHELSRNLLPMIRGLDEIAAQYKEAGFQSFTVMLYADRTQGEERIKTVSNAVRLGRPLVLSLDGLEGPGGFALNRKCTLTLVVVKNGKVHRSVGYTDTNPDDVPALRKLIEEVAGSPRDAYRSRLPKETEALRDHAVELAMKVHDLEREIAELRRKVSGYERRMNSMRGGRGGAMRRRADGSPEARDSNDREESAQAKRRARPRVGKAPEDAELVSLLRQIISKFSTPDDVDEAFALVDGHVGKDKALEKQAIEMFQLMLSLEYGGEQAKRLAREYLKKRGVEPPKGAETGKSGKESPSKPEPAPKDKDTPRDADA